MQLSDDGTLLATASDDGAVRLQLSQSGDLLASWRPFRDAARAVRFTPDGWLVAAGEDGTVRVYPAAPMAILTRACALLGDDVDREAVRLCAARVTAPRP
jgi:WD40 repeat protein